MLIWRTIEDAMNEDAWELDLGRSDLNALGLITFKNHWGAVQTGITYYQSPGASTLKKAAVKEHALIAAARRRVIAAVPDSVLTNLGALFYKHIA
jgi:hypothetical protein